MFWFALVKLPRHIFSGIKTTQLGKYVGVLVCSTDSRNQWHQGINILKNTKMSDVENQLQEVVVKESVDNVQHESSNEDKTATDLEEKATNIASGNVQFGSLEEGCDQNRKLDQRSPLDVADSNNKTDTPEIEVTYRLRDINNKMVESWTGAFKQQARVQVSYGDIFKGAPEADALVSPANSFGFMDGGIDMVYSLHFGWQMQERLQKVIHEDYDGEVLVGQAAIIPAFPEGTSEKDMCKEGHNEGKAIKYLICAPTMRVPLDVKDTANAYLAFRAIILAVKKHNRNPQNKDCPIRSVLCPGLGTAVGRMPPHQCAKQMFQAFATYDLGFKPELIRPRDLSTVWSHHDSMVQTKTLSSPENNCVQL